MESFYTSRHKILRKFDIDYSFTWQTKHFSQSRGGGVGILLSLRICEAPPSCLTGGDGGGGDGGGRLGGSTSEVGLALVGGRWRQRRYAQSALGKPTALFPPRFPSPKIRPRFAVPLKSCTVSYFTQHTSAEICMLVKSYPLVYIYKHKRTHIYCPLLTSLR